MGSTVRIAQGSSLQKPADVITLLSSLRENDLLLIDEIHAVPSICLEVLYPALEERALDIVIGKELNARTVRIRLPAFTLVGATTALHRLPVPLEGRFNLNFRLEEYSDQQLAAMVRH
ncbi:unnamed protein product [Didymodactylos carnosus]|uniref:RuvB-like AAA+ ATPase domain-containing protein n=1 Tax=Didymodactylos carnosus TaxID=1234261 RepID=A0A8S2CXG6_9BILA|nr:unnamed protein product [Didymodactylos carnosus]CAF3580083.1 unnamed protein product [Didymodactylos carnosus]